MLQHWWFIFQHIVQFYFVQTLFCPIR